MSALSIMMGSMPVACAPASPYRCLPLERREAPFLSVGSDIRTVYSDIEMYFYGSSLVKRAGPSGHTNRAGNQQFSGAWRHFASLFRTAAT
ncbi:hypothetical protein [Aminobacter sp. MSH1]|uniref:hypothetical protein n=1 Tax=Aminobacter sp. MSH1 TaxID=374606 RepID=UPI00131F14CC|nr:hypothetical protein [Aminobacter sp. MSH1]